MSLRRCLFVLGPFLLVASISIVAPVRSNTAHAIGGNGQLAVGQLHACALTTSGGVKCWGANNFGELGDGQACGTDVCPAPVDVSGLTSGVDAISGGIYLNCALTTGGGVKCWGLNSSGALGDGQACGTYFCSTPVDVSGLGSSVAAVSVGADHACALTTGGGVKCWGDNIFGQLGDGTTTFRTTPVGVSGLASGVIAISAGGRHTCAQTVGGGVECWGDNTYGQLARGCLSYCPTPGYSASLTSGLLAVSAGHYHTCVLTAAGGVKCWGSNYTSELGRACGDTCGIGDVTGLTSGIANVSAGNGHTCALTTGGGVKCWGGYDSGPVDVSGLTSGVTAVTAGGNSCAITAGGDVKCWGDNHFSQLAIPVTLVRTTPVDVSGLSSGVSIVSMGSQHSCALSTSGGASCWGANNGGELGDGTLIDRTTPVGVSGMASGVSAVSAGGHHTCAVTGGAVKCWGRNDVGQLGNGTNTSSSTPVSVTGLTTGAAAVSAGANHSCAVTTTGGVKCWGNNDDGQLGDGTLADSNTPVAVSGLLSGIVAVAAGYNHTCALTTGGGVKCWGRNDDVQLGDGQLCGITRCSTPTDVDGLASGVVSISSGNAHSCAVTTGNAVECWGRNIDGQIGVGTYTGPDYCEGGLYCYGSPTSVATATAVSATWGNTCDLTTGTGVKCWGSNGYGQLGNGTTTDSSSPVNVTGLASGVLAVSAGLQHACAIVTGGGVKCWGTDYWGELGDDAPIYSATPVDISGLVVNCSDLDGDTVCDSFDSDRDGDGCPNTSEVGMSATSGGLRDPTNPNDYFNPSHDGRNRVDDILDVVHQYHLDDTDGNPGLPPYTLYASTLNGAIDAVATTINVVSTTGARSADVIQVDAERITYTGKTATSFTGATRGFDGTVAAAHLTGAAVGGPSYNPDTDRTLLGPNAWNLGPPNGQQRVDDILNMVHQFHHDCA